MRQIPVSTFNVEERALLAESDSQSFEDRRDEQVERSIAKVLHCS